MYVHVPAFHAWKCHGKGARTNRKLRKEKTGKRGYVGSDIARTGIAEGGGQEKGVLA